MTAVGGPSPRNSLPGMASLQSKRKYLYRPAGTWVAGIIVASSLIGVRAAAAPARPAPGKPADPPPAGPTTPERLQDPDASLRTPQAAPEAPKADPLPNG